MKKGNLTEPFELWNTAGQSTGGFSPKHVPEISDGQSLVLLITVFVVSRMLLVKIGFQFEAYLDFWQYLDPFLLQTRLLESVYYLHSQPPIMNLMLGAVLKLFPDGYVGALKLLYNAFGLVLCLSLWALMKALSVSPGICLFLTIVFILSPDSMLYENWLFNTYPLAAFLSLSGLSLFLFAKKPSFATGTVFFALLAVPVLTHSMFQLPWFLAISGTVLYFCRGAKKKILLAIAGPLLAVLFVCCKNYYVFGGAFTSSWLGMSLARMTVAQMPVDTLESLSQRGEVSGVAMLKPFQGTSEALKKIGFVPQTHVPALDEKTKSTGRPNYNYIAILQLSRMYLDDAIYIMMHYPLVYLYSVLKSFAIYMRPSNDYVLLESNWRKIENYTRVYNLLFYGQIEPYILASAHASRLSTWIRATGWLIVAWSLILVLFAQRIVQSNLRVSRTNGLVVIFMVFTVLYVMIVGNFFECEENNRLRFATQPFYFALIGLFVTHYIKLWSHRARNANTNSS